MRLLHTATLRLKDVVDNRIPRYAILSHTWGEKEITFRDMQLDVAEKMVGYEKVKNTCSVAAACGFEYVWIDTCCIDKTSSAELSEAINSMYRWYQGANVCYAYLADVPSNTGNNPGIDYSRSSLIRSNFLKSKWFTRGWTLQELIAPSTVIFLDEKWQIIGTKSSLKQVISDITGIPVDILSGYDLETASVAQRMAWASKRETTRVEDHAYCLMGIFGIYMPLLYGEGERAFIRLQEEIMKVSDDYSLFAWRSTTSKNHDGLLATSPASFVLSGNIVRLKTFNRLRNFNGPLIVSNKGIHLTLPLMNIGQNLGLAILNCTEEGRDDMCVAIWMKDISLAKAYFERDQSEKLELVNLSDASSPQSPQVFICVKQGRPAPKTETPKESNEKEITEVMRRRRLEREKTVEYAPRRLRYEDADLRRRYEDTDWFEERDRRRRYEEPVRRRPLRSPDGRQQTVGGSPQEAHTVGSGPQERSPYGRRLPSVGHGGSFTAEVSDSERLPTPKVEELIPYVC